MTGGASVEDPTGTDAASIATRRLTFAVLTVGVVTYSLVQSLLVPVLSEVQERLHAGQVSTTWVLTAYLLSATVSTPLVGRIGDAVGKKRMLVFALGCLSLGSLLAALAPSIGVMIAARAIQGMGGGVLPVSFGLLRDRYPAHRLGGAVATLTSLTAAGFGCGLVLSGPIVELLGYRWLFLLPMVATGLGMLGALFFVPESPVRTPGGVPLVPAVLLSAWLVALLLAVTQGEEWGWGSLVVRLLLLLAVVVFVAWVRVERRASVPLIDLAMMRRRGVWTCNAVAALAGFSTFTSYGFLPRFLQEPTSTRLRLRGVGQRGRADDRPDAAVLVPVRHGRCSPGPEVLPARRCCARAACSPGPRTCSRPRCTATPTSSTCGPASRAPAPACPTRRSRRGCCSPYRPTRAVWPAA